MWALGSDIQTREQLKQHPCPHPHAGIATTWTSQLLKLTAAQRGLGIACHCVTLIQNDQLELVAVGGRGAECRRRPVSQQARHTAPPEIQSRSTLTPAAARAADPLSPLAPHLKMVRVLAKSWISFRTTAMPRSSAQARKRWMHAPDWQMVGWPSCGGCITAHQLPQQPSPARLHCAPEALSSSVMDAMAGP